LVTVRKRTGGCESTYAWMVKSVRVRDERQLIIFP
jgi:hypothetical protein